MMKLSDEQIQLLFDFTKKKLVRYYDLQIELVDHLAANIEEQMEQNKKLKFEDALERVYSGFGLFGFSKIVQEKEKQLIRTNRKRFYRECRSMFYWPQVLVSLTLLGAIYTLSNLVNQKYLRIIFALFAIIYFLNSLINLKKTPKTKKPLLLMQYYSPGMTAAWSYVYFSILLQNHTMNTLYFTIVSFVGLILIIASHRLNEKIRHEAIKLYPEAFS